MVVACLSTGSVSAVGGKANLSAKAAYSKGKQGKSVGQGYGSIEAHGGKHSRKDLEVFPTPPSLQSVSIDVPLICLRLMMLADILCFFVPRLFFLLLSWMTHLFLWKHICSVLVVEIGGCVCR